MAKVFEFRPGSYIDPVSGTVGTNTSGEIVQSEKGLAWRGNGVDSRVLLDSALTLDIDGSSYSFEFWMKKKILDENDAIIGHTTLGFYNQIIFNSVNNLTIESDTTADTAVGALLKKDYDWHHYIISCESGVVTMYQDGVSLVITGSPIADDIILQSIGSCGVSTYTTRGDIARIQIYNHVLTEQERAQLYQEFLKAGPIQKSVVVPLTYSKPVDLSNESGIVSAYNMIPVNGVLVDIAGSKNGTIVGAISSKDGLLYSGLNAKSVFGNIGNIKSIVFRIKLASNNEKIIEGAAGDKLIYTSAGILTYSDFDNAYVNGLDQDIIVAGEWQNVVITSSTDVDFSACTLALNNATYGDFEISDLKMYSDQKDLTFAETYHNSFTEKVFVERFDNFGVGSIL